MEGSLAEFGPSQSDRTPELWRQKEQPDTQKYIPVWTSFGGTTHGIIRDGLGPHGLGVDVACEMAIFQQLSQNSVTSMMWHECHPGPK